MFNEYNEYNDCELMNALRSLGLPENVTIDDIEEALERDGELDRLEDTFDVYMPLIVSNHCLLRLYNGIKDTINDRGYDTDERVSDLLDILNLINKTN
jgi:NurA-like 5'-3' nuclease